MAERPDLALVYARLTWARGHADRVRQLSDTWGESATRETTSLDSERGVNVYRAEVVGDPPTDIALALSDVLHQARATLDNLISLLRGGATDRSAFRIHSDPLVYDLDPWRGGTLQGVPAWALAAIREVQPFDGNIRGHIGQEVARLHRLAAMDRHRALLLAAAPVIDIDQVWASTSHPGETEFRVREGGRVLELDYPPDAQVSAHVGVSILVQEPRLRWTGEAARYPYYPSAQEVANIAVWVVGAVLDQVDRAAPD